MFSSPKPGRAAFSRQNAAQSALSWRSTRPRAPRWRLIARARGGREGSLLATIDRTVTAPGGRLLVRAFEPTADGLPAINRGSMHVQFFVEERERREGVRRELRAAGIWRGR